MFFCLLGICILENEQRYWYSQRNLVVFGGHFGFFALEKNAQHLQSGIHQIWIQHIQIDKKQQKNIIYYEKQGHTIISITPSLD